jgi:hypothetical protein
MHFLLSSSTEVRAVLLSPHGAYFWRLMAPTFGALATSVPLDDEKPLF